MRPGLEMTFVYNNDSDDDLGLVVSLLQKAYNVSLFRWPWLVTQNAMLAHCTMLAQDQCEWVLGVDVDEYIVPMATEPAWHSLRTYLQERPPNVGSIYMESTYGFKAVNLTLETPIGGLVRFMSNLISSSCR